MRILIIDPTYVAVGMARQFMEHGHEVEVFFPLKPGGIQSEVGKGLVTTVPNWNVRMDKVDLVVMTDNNKYSNDLEEYFKKGYPIIGANKRAAELELDRDIGQRILEQYGVETATYEIFDDYDKAISYVKANSRKVFVSKPWGGLNDKSLSYVSKNAADMVFMLEGWKETQKLQGQFLLQEKIDGYEMAVGGWFGKSGWNTAINENWEEKRRCNDGLGQNTGEMGTVMRYVKKSKLFEMALEPCTDYLFSIGYVGYVDMNCIIREDGIPAPLEWTVRFGWPHWYIASALHKGDPVEFLCGLLDGRDKLTVSTNISAGIVMKRPVLTGSHQAPIYGITSKNEHQLYLIDAMDKSAPMMLGGQVKNTKTVCTAGEDVGVVAGTGRTICKAVEAAYETCWNLNWPGSREFRTDIGKHLEKDLPAMQKLGFAEGMKYE